MTCTAGLLALSFNDTPLWTCWNIVVDEHSKVFHPGYLTGHTFAVPISSVLFSLPQDQEHDKEEESDTESPYDPKNRPDQAYFTGRVAAISASIDLTPGIYRRKESLTARISNQYFHGVREDASPSSCSLSIKDNVLWTQAIVLDELRVVHAPFPDELQVRW